MLPNLTDNIKSTVDEFKIGDFISSNEIEEYVGKLPGVKDIIKGLGDALKGLESFIAKIESIIESILEMFDLNGILDSLGLDKLKSFIFSKTSNLLSGGTLNQRETTKAYFMEGCTSFNSTLRNDYGFNIGDLKLFSLLGILEAMMCNGVNEAYSAMYNMFINSDKVANTGQMSIDSVNKLFSKTIAPMMLKSNQSNPIDALGVITGTLPSTLARRSTSNIGNIALDYINKDESKTKSPSELFTSIDTSLSVLDPNYGSIDGDFNVSNFDGMDKYKSLASNFIKSNEVFPDLTNATTTSSNISNAALSLF